MSPERKFVDLDLIGEKEFLTKVQIDNSLEMGWKPEDIMLVMNFPYEYNGVKAIVLDAYCEYSPTASKIYAICKMFELGMIKDEIYWFHDMDAFQLEPLDLELDRNKVAISKYGIIGSADSHYNRRWSTGTIFFRDGTEDVFKWIKESCEKYKGNEEVCLLVMTRHNDNDLLNRIDVLNITYNFATRRRKIFEQYNTITDLPIKVIHFHPFDKRQVYYEGRGLDNMDVCVYGKNPLGKPLVSERLIRLFKKHEITSNGA